MGRPSKRKQRRAEILQAFARVLAQHGYAGATMTALGAEAGIAPGLIHHHFVNKSELLDALLDSLLDGFRTRVQEEKDPDPLLAYIDGALRLDERSDLVSARCWVGVFSEALRNPALLRRMRRVIDNEITTIERLSGRHLDGQQAGAVLAFIIGALVLGAFAPQKTAGFAAPSLRRFVAALHTTE